MGVDDDVGGWCGYVDVEVFDVGEEGDVFVWCGWCVYVYDVVVEGLGGVGVFGLVDGLGYGVGGGEVVVVEVVL